MKNLTYFSLLKYSNIYWVVLCCDVVLLSGEHNTTQHNTTHRKSLCCFIPRCAPCMNVLSFEKSLAKEEAKSEQDVCHWSDGADFQALSNGRRHWSPWSIWSRSGGEADKRWSSLRGENHCQKAISAFDKCSSSVARPPDWNRVAKINGSPKYLQNIWCNHCVLFPFE